MQPFDKEIFTTVLQNQFGKLPDKSRTNLQILLALLIADDKITDIRQAAYMLATVKHECANTWEPIEERGKGKGRPYGKPDPKTGFVYFGRGYVQLTHAKNYQFVGEKLDVDLYNHPTLALQYDTAYKIMSYGMRHGAFTGVGLTRYINGDKCDYVNARRIINGTDCAEKIAQYATFIEGILRTSLIKEGTTS